MARVISFINFKGGVGKTTSAVEIAASLAAYHGKRVLVVDLDPQTNATFYLMDQPQWMDWVKSHGSLKELFEDYIQQRYRFDIHQAIVRDVGAGGLAVKGLDLLPSHLALVTADLQLAGMGGVGQRLFGPQAILKAHLTEVEGDYDYILCDCPPNFNLVTQNGLFASEAYVIPTLPDYLSTLGITLIGREAQHFVTRMQRVLRLARGAFPGPELRGIFFNRVRVMQWGPPVVLLPLHAQSIRMIKDDPQYGPVVFESFVTESVHVGEAPEKKIPISLSPEAEHQRALGQFRRLAEEFLQRA